MKKHGCGDDSASMLDTMENNDLEVKPVNKVRSVEVKELVVC